MSQDSPHHHRTRAIGLAVATSLVSKGGNALLMLLSIPLAYKVLGEERFGIYGTLQTLMWFISMSDLGIGPGVSRRVAQAVAREDRGEQAQVAACGFFITLGFALVAAVFFALLIGLVPVTTLFGAGYGAHEAELRMNLWLAAGLFLVMLVVGTLERGREGFQETYISNGYGAAQNVLAAMILFLGIQTHPTVAFLLLTIYGMQTLMTTLNAGHLLWKRPWMLPKWSNLRLPMALGMMNEGLAFFVAGSVAPILQREGTKFLLGQINGPAAVGRFTILLQLGFFLYGFVYMFSKPLWPAFADAVERGDMEWVRAARRRIVWLFVPMAVLSAGGFALCGPWLADRWLSRHVDLEQAEFGLFGLVFVFMVWSHLHYVMLGGSGAAGTVARVLALETVAVLVLAWLGIHHYGLPGALLGSVAGMALVSAWLLPLRLSQFLRTPRGVTGLSFRRNPPGAPALADAP